jgi:FMN reductase
VSDVCILYNGSSHNYQQIALVKDELEACLTSKGVHAETILYHDVHALKQEAQKEVKGFISKLNQAKSIIVLLSGVNEIYVQSFDRLTKILPKDLLHEKILLPILIGENVNSLLKAKYDLKLLASFLGRPYWLSTLFLLHEYVSFTGINNANAKSRLKEAVDELIYKADLSFQTFIK